MSFALIAPIMLINELYEKTVQCENYRFSLWSLSGFSYV